jgi:HAD superfamily hydrolase (TIGR01509 family)
MFLKNVFFDLDGVLVDACDWHYESLNKSLKEVLNIIISLEDHQKTFNGLPSKTKLKMLQIDEKYFPTILQLKQKYTNEIIENECKHDYDKIEFMKYLKLKKIKIACVTNSITQATHLMLKKIGIFEYFDLILCNEDVSENKPSPIPYNQALKILNSEHKETLIIEDSENGFLAAIKSNVSLLWKVNSAKDVILENFLKIFGADHEVINSDGRRRI